MSENYVVFIEQPIKMDLLKIVTGKLTRNSISDGVSWNPKLKTILHLIHKKTGKVSTNLLIIKYFTLRKIFNIFIPISGGQVSSIKYLAKPISTFHQINAYEEDGFLIVDLCASDDGQAIANYKLQNLRKSGEALDEVNNQER